MSVHGSSSEIQSEMNANILVVIPARGGSKGIPRKNLRSMAGKPLIHYSIQTALNSRFAPDVYVSTDDDEIAAIAEQVGASVIHRDASKAQDSTTLDPVIHDAWQKAAELNRKEYGLIVTMQPTSPLLKTASLDAALEKMIVDPGLDTILSACDDTHLTWKRDGEKFVPNYRERVNRQYLEPVFKETGGFLITRSHIITASNRIGANVELQLLANGEDIDIDTYEDWNLCEFYLKRKKILFVVSGYNEIGLGHVYNTLLIANDILNHQIEFLVDNKSQLAFDKIAARNYRVTMQSSENIADDVASLSPDVVINDRLDTDSGYVQQLKTWGIRVINFEDLGDGARQADLVINAIYPEKEVLPRHYFGHEYFILRDEFFLTPAHQPQPVVKRVLLTFGGVDPNNLTCKVLDAIHGYCQQKGIAISVVAGFGYCHYDKLEAYSDVEVFRNTLNISSHMSQADVVFTSAGRTTYELASLHVPSIVLAQNERELTHFFASAEFGFLNLGIGIKLTDTQILSAFVGLVENSEARAYMSSLMARTDLASGRQRTLKLINDVVEQA